MPGTGNKAIGARDNVPAPVGLITSSAKPYLASGALMINYDPDAKPPIDEAALAEGLKLRMHPIHIICDEPSARVGDHAGVSFIAFVDFVPRIGEIIKLEDNSSCQVTKVFHKVGHHSGTKLISLTITVYAVRMTQ